MRPRIIAAFLFFFAISFGSAHGTTLVTVGNLFYDDNLSNNDVITDSLNDYDWLRWDTLANYDYAQTVAATSAGGEYEQWTMATVDEAQKFVDALLGPHACTTTDITFTVCYNSRAKTFNALLGDNFEADGDKTWFLSDDNIGQTVGYIETFSDKSVYKFNDWSDFTSSDTYSTTGSNSIRPVSWLLYRSSMPNTPATTLASVSVPAPSSITLLAFGLMFGIVNLSLRRHKMDGARKPLS